MILKKLKEILKNKYTEPVVRLLMQGITPREIAITMAGTSVLAIFPVIGATTLLCTLFALKFKLNLPIVQVINYSLSPVQIVLLVPFMRTGLFVFGTDSMHYSIEQILGLIAASPLSAINLLWKATMYAIIVWIVSAPIIYQILYRIFLQIVTRIVPVSQKF